MRGRRRSIGRYTAEFRPFLAEYKSSILAWSSGIVGTLLWISSSIFGSTAIAATAGAVHIVPAVGYYLAYRPFGIEADLTPMVNGGSSAAPDKVAESRGEAILREGECEIHGGVSISGKRDSFEIRFEVPDDLRLELLDIPCEEHRFDRDSNTLSASSVTVRRFSFVVYVYLVGEEDGMTHEYPLRIRDRANDRAIETIDIVTR
jgi:hypothetical protein